MEGKVGKGKEKLVKSEEGEKRFEGGGEGEDEEKVRVKGGVRESMGGCSFRKGEDEEYDEEEEDDEEDDEDEDGDKARSDKTYKRP